MSGVHRHSGIKIGEQNDHYEKRSDSKPSLRKLEDNVALIYAYPDIDPGVIEYYIKQKVKGIVIAGTAFGHIPISGPKSLGPALKKAIKAKIQVFITTQTLYGRVHPYVYSNLRKVSIGIGATYLADMLPEVAYTKLMIALKEEDPAAFMKENIAGELSSREVDDYFLR